MAAGFYKLILWLVYPAVWVRLYWRARREPAYGRRVAERFGRVPPQVPRGCLWFHTVSAGETIAAAPLIAELTERFAPAPVLVTTMTPTGSEQVLAKLGDTVAHCYAPYDFPHAVKRFYARVQPRILVLMETELWPNLVAEARRRGIPVVLINARLSARSARGYARVAGLSRAMLRQLGAIACQSEAHAQRFVALGAAPETTQALGSIKYDVQMPPGFAEQVATLRTALGLQGQSVWIAASTHPGEDAVVLEAFTQVRAQHPQVRLVLVPRHPVRAPEVCARVTACGYTVLRQSAAQAADHSTDHATLVDVVVGDVMGSLLQLYGLADIAFVGGSLVPVGGHNPLEPALCGVPIIVGPHQFNFTEIMQDLQGRGAMQIVATADALAQAVNGWLADPGQRQRAAAAAAAAVLDNRGATERVSALLSGWIRQVLL